jgi:hypothetical protein
MIGNKGGASIDEQLQDARTGRGRPMACVRRLVCAAIAFGLGALALGAAAAAASVAGSGRWKVQRSPNPSRVEDYLNGVAASSSDDVWAVGSTGSRSIIEHWNGAAWKTQKSPNPSASGNDNVLLDVAAVSAQEVWAVGDYDSKHGGRPWALIEHKG